MEENENTTNENTIAENSSGLSSDDKLFGMLCHLASFCVFIGIPFGNIIGPVVLWLLKKNDSNFVDYNGKESINFQITITIASIIAGILCLILVGYLLLLVLFIINIIVVVQASLKANNGETYRYPFSLPFIR